MNLILFLPFLYFFFVIYLFITYLLWTYVERKEGRGKKITLIYGWRMMGDSRPGGPGVAAGPIYSTPGGHIGLCGALPGTMTWYSNTQQGGTSRHLIRAVRPAFPAVFCALLLRLRPGRPTRLGRRKSHRKIKVMKQWRMTNKKYWLYYFREQSGLFLFLTHTFATLEFFRETTFCLGFFFFYLENL